MPDSEQVLPIGHENKPVCGAAFVPGSAQNEPTGPASLLLLNANHSSPLRRRTRWSQAAVFRLSLAPSLRCFCSSPSLVRFAREPCRPSPSRTRRAHRALRAGSVEGVRLYGGGTSTTLNVWNAWVRAYTYTRDDVQYVDHLQSSPLPFIGLCWSSSSLDVGGRSHQYIYIPFRDWLTLNYRPVLREACSLLHTH